MRHTLALVWRRLRNAPVMSAVIVVSLAVGIGANASVFSWIQGRLLRPLPGVTGSADLLLIEPVNDNGLYVGMSWPEYQDVRASVPSLPSLIASRMIPLYVGEPGATERASGLLVSDNYFRPWVWRRSWGVCSGPRIHGPKADHLWP